MPGSTPGMTAKGSGLRVSSWAPVEARSSQEDMTCDPEADAALVYLARGKIAETAEIQSDLVVDDAIDICILSLEILSANRQLARGEWSRLWSWLRKCEEIRYVFYRDKLIYSIY